MTSFQIAFGRTLAAIVTAALIPGAATAQQYTISTVAGIGTARGYYGDTGSATQALLNVPLRVAVDTKGNYYIVDYYNYAIREVTASGIISTIAGNGITGFAGDGLPGTQAEITDVHGIAVDSTGNVYIADTGNSRVRIIDVVGNMSTFAGGAGVGYSGDGGKATAAALSRPSGIAIDSSGNVYIADYGNSTVRKVSTTGIITTIAGTGAYGESADGGPANKAALGAPYALAFDPAGNLYISDLAFETVREIPASGNIETAATGVAVQSMAVDAAGNIYYPDYTAQTVQKLFPNGAQVSIAGNGTMGFSGDGGSATAAQLNQPYGVAFGAKGTIYVADSGNMVIRLLTPVSSSIGIVNAASNTGGAISPGEIVVLYGTGIGPGTLVPNQPVNGFFGTSVGGTTVSFNGTLAPLLYSSANQVAAIVPYEVVPNTTASVSVNYGSQSLTTTIPVQATTPGLFTVGSLGSGQASAINQDGTINSASNPALIGSYISLYGTGAGQTNPAGIDGMIQSGSVLPQPLAQVAAIVGGPQTGAYVAYAGSGGGAVAGLLQVNVQIPVLPLVPGAPPVSVPVVVNMNGLPSQTAVSIFVATK